MYNSYYFTVTMTVKSWYGLKLPQVPVSSFCQIQIRPFGKSKQLLKVKVIEAVADSNWTGC